MPVSLFGTKQGYVEALRTYSSIDEFFNAAMLSAAIVSNELFLQARGHLAKSELRMTGPGYILNVRGMRHRGSVEIRDYKSPMAYLGLCETALRADVYSTPENHLYVRVPKVASDIEMLILKAAEQQEIGLGREEDGTLYIHSAGPALIAEGHSSN